MMRMWESWERWRRGGDEDLDAAGVEEVIVAPEVHEEVLHRDYFSYDLTEAFV